MTLDQLVAVFSALIALAGLVFVGFQMRAATQQRRIESVQRLIDANRELLSLAFSHPTLFDVYNDTGKPDPQWEKSYLQLWLNHLAMVHTLLKYRGFDPDFREGLEKDMADSFTLGNMQRHWLKVGQFYSTSFQKRVNAIIAKQDGLL